jgi:hypothetical protein
MFPKKLRAASFAAAGLVVASSNCVAQSTAPIKVDQGLTWTEAVRKNFYSRDQGSRLIPLAWLKALKHPNGEPFLADGLARYGYLPDDANPQRGLPIGFSVAREKEGDVVGLTCAACHTRQIEVEGKAYRIDGGPAIADLGALWAELNAAVHRALASEQSFADFAKSALGASPSPQQIAALRKAVEEWSAPFDAITQEGLLKAKPWGLGRLDAVGMIFNRVAGLDIGPPPTFILKENMKPADAPVRPPFLWNASIQDRTQWPGFAENGNTILALSRNLGEVYGVFGIFHPKQNDARPLGFDYDADNSANFAGLLSLEQSIERLGPPRWPWPVDRNLAATGKAIFARPKDKGGCAECHGIQELPNGNWVTPITPIGEIGTDAKELLNLKRTTVSTGVLTGASIPFLMEPLKGENEAIANVLGVAVRGAVLQYYFPGVRIDPRLRARVEQALLKADDAIAFAKPLLKARIAEKLMTPKIKETLSQLKGAYPPPPGTIKPPPGYEARVLQGIWAAAPYLHNGSVASLAELLKPAKERASRFQVGPAYDIVNVGLAAEQTKFNHTQPSDDCVDPRAPTGDGHCGHEFGVSLSAEEKKALLEYLKTL